MSAKTILRKALNWGAISILGGPVMVVALLVVTGPLLSSDPVHLQPLQPAHHFENNYRPGTEGYVLTQLANEAFPYLDILISDKRFQPQMTEASKAAHPLDSMNLVHRLGEHHLSDASLSGRRTKVMGSMAWEKEFLSLNVCLVYLTPEGLNRSRSDAMITVFHESIHCSRAKLQQVHGAYYAREMRGLLARMPALKDQGGKGNTELRRLLFFVSEEAFVTASERSLSFRPGAVGVIAKTAYSSELESAKRNAIGNESPHVALLMEGLCAKAGDCPTDTPALSSFLLENRTYIAALEKDVQRWAEIRR